MLCFVTQPSSKSLVMEVVVDPKAEGQEILDKVCEQLGIIEVDYFGLQYAGSKGEHLWLNMRNEIQQQLMGQPPYRLQLRVKFFLQPHLILQDVTRHQLYLQVKQDICEGLLKVPCLEQMAKILALIAQAELGDCVRNNATAPLQSVYSSFYPPIEKNERLAVLVAAEHGHLAGLAQGSCVYRMLQDTSAVQGYGVEWYEARENTANFLLGVGPEGISIFDEEGNEQPRIEYPTLQTVSHHARSCLLSVIDDSGEVISRSFRLVSASAANGLYRCLTEMHSFYRCDTVRNAVTDQFSLDLKGRFVSLFNENTTTGRKYVFDIRRTRQEAYDHYRRILHSNNPGIPCSNEAPPGGETRNESEMMICDCDNDNDNEKEIDSDDSVDNFNVLKQRLEKFQDAMLCRVCMDMSISIAFIPCGHLVCCSECASCVEKCPLCRSQIQHAQQIYLPTCLTAT